MRYTQILFGFSLMIASACAPIAAQTSVYQGNNNAPNIVARIAVGDSYHEATPDNQYVLMSGSEGVLVLRRDQSDNQGRPAARTFLPHPGLTHFVYFYDGNTKYVATFGQNSLRIYTWNSASGPQTHTGTVYSIATSLAGAAITSMGVVRVSSGEGGYFWGIALGSAKPSKVYLFTLNGALAGQYDVQGGSGVYAIASDPYNNYLRLAATGDGGLVSIFTSSGDLTNPLTISAKLTGGRATLTHVAFVPSYTPGVVALGSDGRLYYWNTNSPFYSSTPKAIVPLSEQEPLTSLRFTPNGYAMIAGQLPYAYMVQMPTASEPERIRFTGARPLVNWSQFYRPTLAEISAYAMRLFYTTPLTSNRMLATPAAAYMDYKDAPWDATLELGVVPLASCVAYSGDPLAVFTTTNRRIVFCSPGYVSSGTLTGVIPFNLASIIPAPIHSIAYLGEARSGARYFVYAFGDSQLGIGFYQPGTPANFQHVRTIATPSDVRGALQVDTIATGTPTATVACASPTDGTVLMYRWDVSNPSELIEYSPSDDSDKLRVEYVIRDVKVIRDTSGAVLNVGGAIRRQAFFTSAFNLSSGYSGRPNIGPAYDGLKFAWNPSDPTKFALISYGNPYVWIDVPFSGPLGTGYRPEINRGNPTQIQYYSGQGVIISFGRFMESFRRTGNQYVHTGTITPQRVGSFTTLSYGFAVGGYAYAVAGVSNGSASFVLPEAVLVTDSPVSVPFSYNFAYATSTFYTLSNSGSSGNRYLAIAYPSLISPRPAGTSILRLDASSPTGYTVERALPGSYFLNPYPRTYGTTSIQLIHTTNSNNTVYYRLSDIITNPDTATPLGTISGAHHRFSFNGHYCITQSPGKFTVYRWDPTAGWQSYGDIILPSGQADDLARCYISDSGQYAVVFRDYYDGVWHFNVDVYGKTGGSWVYNWTLPHQRVYAIYNFDHGAGSYSDYEPFVFIPETNRFCVNYKDASNAARFAHFDATASSPPPATQIGEPYPSYTYGFLKDGSSVYIFRGIADPHNNTRMAIYHTSNPTTPVAQFGRETNRSFSAQRPLVGNEGFGLFTNYIYGVIFNFQDSNP